MAQGRLKPSTINTTLAAIADFYTRRGLGPPDVRRLELPQSAPRALAPRGATRWLRAVQACLRPRDRLLGLIPFYAGLRIGEAVALDLDDVRLSARKGVLIVRSGKGDRYREVPVHPELRANLAIWLDERPDWPGATANPALFLNRRAAA
jgi:site-specific recombinase XerC